MILQLWIGFVPPTLLAMPVNLLVGAAVLYVGAATEIRASHRGGQNALISFKSTVTLITAMICALLIVGFVPQYTAQYAASVGGVWGRLGVGAFTKTWIFAWLCFWFLAALASVVTRRLRGRWSVHKIGFLLNHVGLLVAAGSMMLGSADKQVLDAAITSDRAVGSAYCRTGVVELPFSIALGGDTTDPDRITIVLDSDLKRSIAVNHPVRYKGYSIYPVDYNRADKGDGEYCMIKIVRQPWIGVTYAGFIIMTLGAVMLFMTSSTKNNEL